MSDVFVRDENGDVVNPPVIPEHEAAITAAANAADESALQKAQKNYDKAREELITEIEKDNPPDDVSGTPAVPVSEKSPGDDWPQTQEEFDARQAREKAAWESEHKQPEPVSTPAPDAPAPAPEVSQESPTPAPQDSEVQ